MEDDYDDVDWASESDENDKQNENVQQNGDINITLDLPSNTARKVQLRDKTVKVVYTDDLYESSLKRHQNECHDMLFRIIDIARWSEDESVSCLMLSLLPTGFTVASLPKTLSSIKELCAMFISMFKVLPNDDVTVEEGRDGSASYDLESFVIANHAGSAQQLTQLFYSLVKSLGFNARYVCSIDPLCGYLPQDYDDLHRIGWETSIEKSLAKRQQDKHTTSSSSKHSWKRLISNGSNVVDDSNEVTTKVSDSIVSEPVVVRSHQFKPIRKRKEQVPIAWVEVLLPMPNKDAQSSSSGDNNICSKSGSRGLKTCVDDCRWVHVDAVHQLFDQPNAVEMVLRKGVPIRYVVGVSSGSNNDKVNSRDSNSVYNSNKYATIDLTAKYKHVYRHCTVRDRDIQTYLSSWFHSTVEGTQDGGRTKQKKHGLSMPQETTYIDLIATKSEVVDLCSDSVDENYTNNNAHNFHVNDSSNTKKRKVIDGDMNNTPTSAMPTRFTDFKNHPEYLLERHLLTEEAIHPEAKGRGLVGMFRGECVYLQKHKEKLRSRGQWRRELRSVIADQEPVRVITRKKMNNSHNRDGIGSSSSSIDNNSSGGRMEIKLFGSWQTIPLEIPPVVDGVIPMNEYGNIEIWEGRKQFVPRGAVFIDDPYAIRAAKNLGIVHVPAVTGFETKGQFTVPQMGGVVVLKEHEQLVLDATFYLDAVREENQYVKRDNSVNSKWKKLVNALLSRQKLKDTYGH